MSLSMVWNWITCKKFLEVVAPAFALVARGTYNFVKHEMITITYYGFEKPKIKKSCRVHTKDWLQPSKNISKMVRCNSARAIKKFVFWIGGEIKHVIFVYQLSTAMLIIVLDYNSQLLSQHDQYGERNFVIFIIHVGKGDAMPWVFINVSLLRITLQMSHFDSW